jgi:predicted nuclease of predicted toxin-antitoxin system
VKFLVDRCAGRRLAEWLRQQGHEVAESRERGPDPGDPTVLEWAAAEGRILVTIDTDFGELLFVEKASHSGVVRLPDVPANKRIELIAQVLERYSQELEAAAIITVRGGRIRISK